MSKVRNRALTSTHAHANDLAGLIKHHIVAAASCVHSACLVGVQHAHRRAPCPEVVDPGAGGFDVQTNNVLCWDGGSNALE